jgi:hypothetical protein
MAVIGCFLSVWYINNITRINRKVKPLPQIFPTILGIMGKMGSMGTVRERGKP